MRYPNLKEEKKLWKKGYKFIVGLDEAGRGPLAGPVFAAAVCVLRKNREQSSAVRGTGGINDSKKLTGKQREYFYKILTSHPQIKWGVGQISEKVIDKINILEATKLAMKKAISNLEKKLFDKLEKTGKISALQNSRDRVNFVELDYLIIDGNFKINSKIPQKSIIKGDQKVFSCAAASIIAKVLRDKKMRRYHNKYPKYRFDLHKGYPTKLHSERIRKYGFCPIHRRTFSIPGA